MTSIGDDAFGGCNFLTSITIPISVTSIGNRTFHSCFSLTSVTIPNSVTTIGDEAFFHCYSLTSVTIPSSVTTIGSYAFAYCSSLTSVTIPSSVTTIRSYAFAYCSSLTSVTVNNETPISIESSVFSNRTNATLYVPVGSKAAYEVADYWKEFKEIVEMEETPAQEFDDTDISQMDNVIYVDKLEVLAGTTVKLCVKMKNQVIANGCSFKLTLPEGFALVKDEDGDIIYELSSRAKKMSVVLRDWENRTYDFALTPSTALATISGEDETFITLNLSISEDVVKGNYMVKLTKCLIQSKEDGVTKDIALSDVVRTITVEDYVLGDVNSDKNVSPADAIMILYHYFEVEQSGFNEKAADINNDGKITPADAIEVLYRYFESGSQSPQM